MAKTTKWFLIVCLAVGASWARVALADVDNTTAANVQEGDNDSESSQSGDADSGDAVVGQVAGVVSAGDTSVDATNRSEDVDASTGDAEGFNSAAATVGHSAGDASLGISTADIDNLLAVNVQEGDNDHEVDQDASVTTGDGVGGQVIGVVTSAGGSADVVAANTSEGLDVNTGDGFFANNADTFLIPPIIPPIIPPGCPLPADSC